MENCVSFLYKIRLKKKRKKKKKTIFKPSKIGQSVIFDFQVTFHSLICWILVFQWMFKHTTEPARLVLFPIFKIFFYELFN